MCAPKTSLKKKGSLKSAYRSVFPHFLDQLQRGQGQDPKLSLAIFESKRNRKRRLQFGIAVSVAFILLKSED